MLSRQCTSVRRSPTSYRRPTPSERHFKQNAYTQSAIDEGDGKRKNCATWRSTPLRSAFSSSRKQNDASIVAFTPHAVAFGSSPGAHSGPAKDHAGIRGGWKGCEGSINERAITSMRPFTGANKSSQKILGARPLQVDTGLGGGRGRRRPDALGGDAAAEGRGGGGGGAAALLSIPIKAANKYINKG